VPKGPSTYNEFIEKELVNYRKQIELRFLSSELKQYQFYRVNECVTYTLNTNNSCDLGKIERRKQFRKDSVSSSLQKIRALMNFYPNSQTFDFRPNNRYMTQSMVQSPVNMLMVS
jgi:hypothetical protein